MDPFDTQNPLQPFGFPGDPMDDVLSLQALEYEAMKPIDSTNGCTTNGCTTNGCTVGC